MLALPPPAAGCLLPAQLHRSLFARLLLGPSSAVLFDLPFDPRHRFWWQPPDAGPLAGAGAGAAGFHWRPSCLFHPHLCRVGRMDLAGCIALAHRRACRCLVDEAPRGPISALRGLPAKAVCGPGLGGKGRTWLSPVAQGRRRSGQSRWCCCRATGCLSRSAVGVACLWLQTSAASALLLRLRGGALCQLSQSARRASVAARPLASHSAVARSCETAGLPVRRQSGSAPSGVNTARPWASTAWWPTTGLKRAWVIARAARNLAVLTFLSWGSATGPLLSGLPRPAQPVCPLCPGGVPRCRLSAARPCLSGGRP